MKTIQILIVFVILLIAGGTYGQRTIIQDAPVTLTVLSQADPSCGGSDGSISVSATPSPAIYLWSTGATTATLTGLAANTYTVTATSSGTICTATQAVTLNGVVAPSITQHPAASTILCAGDALSLFITATGTGLTYQWRKNAVDIPGATSSTYTVPTTTTNDGGSYQCIVKSGNCTANSNIGNVTVKPQPTVNVPNATITYPGSTTLTATGGGTYLWNTGATTVSITVAPTVTTTYTVTVTGTNGCSAVDNATVTVNGGPLAISSVSANPANICTGASTQLNVVVSNGVGPYLYSWSNGATTSNQMVSPSTTTTYNVTVTDANLSTVIGSITVNVASLPTANAGLDQTDTLGSAFTIGTPGIVGNTYVWSSWPVGFTSVLANPAVSPLVTTQYMLTVTDSTSGCSSTDSVSVNITGGTLTVVNNAIISSMGTTINIGQFTELKVIVSGGQPPYAYVWNSNPSGFTSNAFNLWANPQTNTMFAVTITDANSLTQTASILVNVLIPNPPTATVGFNTQNQTICDGDSASFAITLGGASPWSVTYNDGTNNVVVNSIMSSPYTVTVSPSASASYLMVSVTDSLGQTNTATGGLNITVNPSPTVTLGPDKTICAGDSVVLYDQSGGSYPYYLWSTGATTSTITLTPGASTSYILQASNASFCEARDTVLVTVNPLPIINAGLDQAICAGDSVTLTATGGVSYIWNPGGIVSPSIPVTPTSTTTYSVTGGSINGCFASNDVTVYVNANPIANAGSDKSICSGTVTLTATGGVSYAWSGGVTQGTPFTPSTTTNYIVTVTGSNSCTATDMVTVNVYPMPTVNAGLDQNICAGASTTIGSSTANGNFISWDNTSSLSNPSIIQPTASPSTTTVYTVTVNNTQATGCMVTDQVVVNVNPNPIVTASSVPTCANINMQLFASADVSGCSFLWSPATGLTGANTATPIFNSGNSQTYVVMATSSAGCVGTQTVTVTVTQIPVANFTGTYLTGTNGQVQFNNASTSATSYAWDFGDQTTSSEATPIHQYIASGNYNVNLTATNQCGSDIGSSMIMGVVVWPTGVEENAGAIALIYPNPVKDVLYLSNIENLEYFKVYNMLGEMIHEQKLGSIPSFEFDMSNFPSGVYYFVTENGNPVKVIKE